MRKLTEREIRAKELGYRRIHGVRWRGPTGRFVSSVTVNRAGASSLAAESRRIIRAERVRLEEERVPIAEAIELIEEKAPPPPREIREVKIEREPVPVPVKYIPPDLSQVGKWNTLMEIAERLAQATDGEIKAHPEILAIDILFPDDGALSREQLIRLFRANKPTREELRIFPRLHIGTFTLSEDEEGEEIEDWISLAENAVSGSIEWKDAIDNLRGVTGYARTFLAATGITLRTFRNGPK